MADETEQHPLRRAGRPEEDDRLVDAARRRPEPGTLDGDDAHPASGRACDERERPALRQQHHAADDSDADGLEAAADEAGMHGLPLRRREQPPRRGLLDDGRRGSAAREEHAAEHGAGREVDGEDDPDAAPHTRGVGIFAAGQHHQKRPQPGLNQVAVFGYAPISYSRKTSFSDVFRSVCSLRRPMMSAQPSWYVPAGNSFGRVPGRRPSRAGRSRGARPAQAR